MLATARLWAYLSVRMLCQYLCPLAAHGVSRSVGRNQEFLDLAVDFTMVVMKDRFVINLVPGPFKT